MVKEDNVVRLALFFSHGVSLETWDTQGLFDREVGYYQALAEVLGPVAFVTYDRPGPDLEFLLTRVKPVSVLYNCWRLPYSLFGFVAPLMHAKSLRHCGVFKSNQLSGSWTPAIAARLFRRPLVVRCGFIQAQMESETGKKTQQATIRTWLETFALRSATLIFVATDKDRDYLVKTYGLAPEKFRVMGNPIDCNRFCPSTTSHPRPGTVVCVGRLHESKNIDLLIDACNRIPKTR